MDTVNVNPQENQQEFWEGYVNFHMMKVEPKIQELIAAGTKKARAKIQREIINIIKDAGYHNEAIRMIAMFNL
ncbi:hypothetical protein [Lysinibacillus capsici]|uniref:hypothetical protein n=1 Tax=Lysinibacillus capsici TaxID=2115968 RepID=UPI0034E5E02A